MKRRNFPGVRRCCNGSSAMRGRASLYCTKFKFHRRKKMSKVGKDRTQPAGTASSMNHGVKNPNKCANKYDGWGTKKGSNAGKANPGAQKG